nr:MAG TPA: hypothetical protein [Caudoviricetes sp.]
MSCSNSILQNVFVVRLGYANLGRRTCCIFLYS